MKKSESKKVVKNVPNWKKIKFIIYIIFGILSMLLILVPLITNFSSSNVEAILRQYYAYSISIYVILIAIAAATTLPISIVLIAGRFVFGFWTSIIYAFLAIFIGASAVYLLSAKMGREFLIDYGNIKGKRLKAFNSLIHNNSVSITLLLNWVYFTPSNLAHMVAGITKMDFRKFLIITGIGNFPNVLAIAMIAEGVFTKNYLLFSSGILIILLITIIPLYIFRKHVREILMISFGKNKVHYD
jgi:uncharacterized membrane protein YdjX (TVP38/TMEM64 family)